MISIIELTNRIERRLSEFEGDTEDVLNQMKDIRGHILGQLTVAKRHMFSYNETHNMSCVSDTIEIMHDVQCQLDKMNDALSAMGLEQSISLELISERMENEGLSL